MADIFDSHAHYDEAAFDSDREELLSSLPESGVCGVVNCGTDLRTSRASVELAASRPFVYAAVGIHPECVKDAPADVLGQLEKLLSEKKTVAVGEIGLDYHFKENAPREAQRAFFSRQVRLALDHRLPIIVHDREAHNDTMEVLRKLHPAGVVHCFSGSVEMAKEVLRLGLYIGIGGSVTFKNARVPVEVARMVPDDRFLMETDCPYMAPVPFRGKRNDSTRIVYTAAKVAEIRGTTADEILRITRKNAETLFRISEKSGPDKD